MPAFCNIVAVSTPPTVLSQKGEAKEAGGEPRSAIKAGDLSFSPVQT